MSKEMTEKIKKGIVEMELDSMFEGLIQDIHSSVMAIRNESIL